MVEMLQGCKPFETQPCNLSPIVSFQDVMIAIGLGWCDGGGGARSSE